MYPTEEQIHSINKALCPLLKVLEESLLAEGDFEFEGPAGEPNPNQSLYSVGDDPEEYGDLPDASAQLLFLGEFIHLLESNIADSLQLDDRQAEFR
jgi:hypothetical protein